MTTNELAALRGPIRTEGGQLVGVESRLPGVTVFKGIRYGASTAGVNRWRPPQPPAPWEGLRTADSFGDIAPQSHGKSGIAKSEDCLSLNVWTGAASADEHRPVFVWVHGGRFSFGHGSEPVYDGASLAAKGVVVVTINMRLGVLGYLATPELSSESGHAASGNYGILDAIAALGWVQRNIAAFGGDPGRVTVGGHSSGGATTMGLIYSPLAKGLFQQALIESAAPYPKDPAIATLASSHRDLPQAEQDGAAFMRQHGATSLEELRALPLDELLAGSDVDDPSVPGTPPPPLFRPVVDGWVLAQSYWETLTSGAANPVRVLTGNNRDESGAKPRQEITLTEYVERSRARYGDLAEEYLALYPAQDDPTAGDALNSAYRESTRLSTWMWASEFAKRAGQPVYTYYWNHVPPGPDGEARGAFHGSEIPYVFNNLQAENRDYSDTDHEIADRLSDYVVNFISNGDPNGGELPSWPAVDPATARTFEIGDDWRPVELAAPDRVAFTKRFFDTQRAW